LDLRGESRKRRKLNVDCEKWRNIDGGLVHYFHIRDSLSIASTIDHLEDRGDHGVIGSEKSIRRSEIVKGMANKPFFTVQFGYGYIYLVEVRKG